MTYHDFYDKALAGLKKLKEEDKDRASLISCFEDIVSGQKEAGETAPPDLSAVDKSLCRKRLGNGMPCIRPADIRADGQVFGALFDRIGQACRRHAETDSSGEWGNGSNRNGHWHETVIAGVLGDEKALARSAEEAGLDLPVLTFVACQTLPPFMAPYAAEVSDCVEESNWEKGRCPLCGSEPLMGELARETGKRTLQCHLCRTEWEFKRMACPFCGTEDQKKLRFFCDGDDKLYRVEVCDKCRMYLKTLDRRETEEDPVLFVANLATLHLDLVAKHEGFTRETNRLFGV